MNILFDESVDARFQKVFALRHANHTMSNVTIMHWSPGSDLMVDLTAVQKDNLLLRFAKKTGFSLFITSDIQFHQAPVLPINVIIIDAQDNAPSEDFLNSIVHLLDQRIALIEEEAHKENRKPACTVIKSKTYKPSPVVQNKPSRLASAILRPSRGFER